MSFINQASITSVINSLVINVGLVVLLQNLIQQFSVQCVCIILFLTTTEGYFEVSPCETEGIFPISKNKKGTDMIRDVKKVSRTKPHELFPNCICERLQMEKPNTITKNF